MPREEHSTDRSPARGTRKIAVARAIILLVSFFVIDRVLNAVVLGEGWQIFWPLGGATVALLVMREVKEWPLIVAATCVGQGLGELFENAPRVVVIECMLSTLEVLMSAALLPRFYDIESWLRQRHLYRRFAAAVVIPPVLLTALQFALSRAGYLPYLGTFSSSAMSEMIGIAAVLPLVLAASSTTVAQLRSARWWGSFLGTMVVAVLVMSGIFVTNRYPLIFVLYPLLMWVDWRLSLLGSSGALCCACLMSVFLTEHGYGPFANMTFSDVSRNMAVQIYLAFHLVGFLPVSILFTEKRRIDRELRTALARADALAMIDGLTNIANRRCFEEQLKQQWTLGIDQHRTLALLMIDADYFKEFNDTLGHQAGDQCLREIAEAITRCVVGDDQLVARFGGEEFAVLLPDTSLNHAREIAESIRVSIFEGNITHPSPNQMAGRVTVSVGCAALIPPSNLAPQALIEAADSALYKAKRYGRNRVWADDTKWESWVISSSAMKIRRRLEALRFKGR